MRTTGEKVSKKLLPYSWVYPLTTKRALYRSKEPFHFIFTLYTHLHPMVFLSIGRGTISEV